MKLHHHRSTRVFVPIRERTYPVTIAGSGRPALIFGLGTLITPTLSDRFMHKFTVYSCDMYWDEHYRLTDPYQLTMKQILDDNAELARNLHVPPCVAIGHSAFGIVALEFAKTYPALVQGIILIGTPPNSNQQVAAQNQAYFEKHADEERKAIDTKRRHQFDHEKLSLNSYQRFLRAYTWRDAPRYWHIPDFDCTPLWQDIIVDQLLFDHFFSKILPETDVTQNLETIKCPIFLAAGDSDYDCCPLLWHKIANLPAQMLISRFRKSGHWPQYEEQRLFDQKIQDWITHYDLS